MLGPRLLILTLGLLATRAQEVAIEGPGAAEVAVEEIEVYEAPDESSLVTGRLVQGERVEVRSAEEGGWLAIEPPPGSFCWIAREALDEGADAANATEARVIVARA